MTVTAKDIMTSPAVTVAPQASLAEVSALLVSKRISAVPVCNPDGSLAGLISEADVIRPFRESVRLRQNWWLGLLAEGENLSQEFLDYQRQDTRSAADLMARHVIIADEQTTVPQLAELMTSHGVKRIPILRDGRVTGIVSRSDLVAAIARAPAMLV